MSAKFNYVASVSTNPTTIATLYETIFGMEFDNTPRPVAEGELLSDGNVLLNLRPRLPGHRVGLDHFGIEIDNLEETLEKLRSNYPSIGWKNNPLNHPCADRISHDPAGSIFALTEKRAASPEPAADRPVPVNFARWSKADPAGRTLHHYAIRTRKLEECADFYEDVFGFTHSRGADGDPNHYMSDGCVTLILIPWSIQDYAQISVTGRGPEFIGFKVEDADLVRDEIEGFYGQFAAGQAPIWLLTGISRTTNESQIRAAMIDKSCPISRYRFTDRDGTFVVIADKDFGEA